MTRKNDKENWNGKNQSCLLLLSFPLLDPEAKAPATPVSSTNPRSKSFQLLRPSTTSVKSFAIRSTISCWPPPPPPLAWPNPLSSGRPCLSNRSGSSSTSLEESWEGLRVFGLCLVDRLGRLEEGSESRLRRWRWWRRWCLDSSGLEGDEGSS